jgi:hypothetical protein
MSSENNPTQFALTIAFTDPELTNEERDDEVVQLLEALSDRAEVSMANAKKVLGFLGDRLGNKPISLKVEKNGKKLEVTANSQEEFEFVMQKANEFFEIA